MKKWDLPLKRLLWAYSYNELILLKSAFLHSVLEVTKWSRRSDFWLTVTNETKISTSSGKKLPFEKLEVGELIDIWFSGHFKQNAQGKSIKDGDLEVVFIELKDE